MAQTGMGAKELSPFDPKHLTGETIRTLGSAAATVAMGLYLEQELLVMMVVHLA